MTHLAQRHTVEAGMFVRTHEGGEPTLLFVHGLGESGVNFERIVGHPRLARFRRVVPDLPGCGRSAWPAEPLSLVATADHLATWLEGRGERPVVAVGHSMGGVLAILLGERHGDLVRAVVDVDGNVSAGDCAYSSRAAAQTLERFAGSGLEALRSEVYAAGMHDEALRGYYVALRLADPRTYHLHSLDLVEMSRNEGLARRLATLPIPVLYVAGVPGGASERSLALLRDAGVRIEALSPSGHWPFVDRHDAFAEVVAGFAASPRPTRPRGCAS